MHDIDGLNTKFADEEEVQITDLDKPDSPQQRWISYIIGRLKTPWLRYGFSATLILLVLGTLLHQWQALTPAIPDVAPTPPPGFLSATTTQGMVIIQSTDHILTAYQAATGQVRWRTNLFYTASVDVEGQILFCYFTISPDKTVMEALAIYNGNIIWQDTLSASPAAPWPASFMSQQITMQRTVNPPGPSFLYNNNILYIQNSSNLIYTIQAASGRLKGVYRVPTIDYPIIDGQVLYALQPPIASTVQAFRLSDGHQLWANSFPQGTWAQAEKDGVVYLSTNKGTTLVALRGSDGRTLWSYYASTGANTFLGAYNGIAYLLQQDTTLVSIRISDGSVLWRVRLTEFENAFSPTIKLLVDQDHILLYDPQPNATTPLYVLRASDGYQLWHTSGPIVNPVPLNGTLYTVQNNGQIDAWRESDGQPLWGYHAPAGTSIIPTTSGNSTLLFLLNNSGTFSTLRASDGRLLWHYH